MDVNSPIEKKRTKNNPACTFCKKRHLKCDGVKPCSNCKSRDEVCVFVANNKRGPKTNPESKLHKSKVSPKVNKISIMILIC